MTVCQWLYDSRVADPKSGQRRFRDVLRDEPRMRRIFEKFVRRLLVRNMPDWSVRAERMDWQGATASCSDRAFLPTMLTDVTLRSAHRTVIIECKYTDCLATGRFLEPTLKSQHLYQLSAYLRNLEYRNGPDSQASGILLYPTTGAAFDHEYLLHGHRLRVLTLDLRRPPAEIKAEVLSLASCWL
jgi:5-methylcytosine-specific restriction enzyme subunit McrC